MIVFLTSLPVVWGLLFTRRASAGDEANYFTAGRDLPWWAVGISNTATYHGGAAPFVMLIFMFGFAGNWLWWPQWIIWMPLVAVIWARMWRRLNIVTTAELIVVRYGGRPARLARRVYALAMFCFAVILTAYTTVFFAKAIYPLMPLSVLWILLIFGSTTVLYTIFGGLIGSVMASVVQTAIFVLGGLLAVAILIPQFGGWDQILARVDALRPGTLSLNPVSETVPPLTMLMFIVLGLFFAGSPTAGEGFTAQRFMSARNERHAMGGQLLNALLSLSLRMMPIIPLGILAMALFWHANLVERLGSAPAGVKMLADPVHAWGELLKAGAFPPGIVGLLVATEIAAYVSSLSAFINWGSSFIVNDLYKDIFPRTSARRDVMVSRVTSLVMFLLSAFVAVLYVNNMVSWFLFINSIMVIFWLPLAYFRFFWSRFNVWGELAASVLGLPLSILIWFVLGLSDSSRYPFWLASGTLFLTAVLVIAAVTLLTPPESEETLTKFYQRCRPLAGWRRFRRQMPLPPGDNPPLRHLVFDSALGMAACFGLVMATNALFAGRWMVLVLALAAAVGFGTWMIRRSLGSSSAASGQSNQQKAGVLESKP